ncbi:MAG TPA: hypothetical protein DCG04_19395, partial [Rhodospirillaceae bacterium]|nr:hypothetical protein [Rhodospirillaceae bacterium]
ELAIVSTAQGFSEALSQVEVTPTKRDHSRVADLHEAYLDSLKPIETPGDVKMEDVVKHVDAATDDHA